MEFKESWVEDAMCDVAALANTRGGTLHLGVNKAGYAVGCDTSDEGQQAVANKIINHLRIIPDIREIAYGQTPTLAVSLRKSAFPVLHRGVYYVRAGTVTQRAPEDSWGRLVLAQLGQSWDAQPADASVADDIDESRVRDFIRSAKGRKNVRLPDGAREDDPIEIILGNLALLSHGVPTNAALLLFGKQPQRLCRAARVSLGYFRDNNDFDAFPDVTGTVFEQIEGALRAVAAAHPPRVTFDGDRDGDDIVDRTRRHEAPAYPDLALKEAVTNAIVHRDYTRVGAEVQIRMYPDRLVIFSPGGLPPGLTAAKLREVPHPSEKRNPLIAEICFMDYWVERYGTGTTRMIELCREAGLPEPEFSAEPENFTVTFRRDALSREALRAMGRSEAQVLLLLYTKQHGSISNARAQELLEVPRRTAARELEGLRDLGWLELRGRGRGAHYVLGNVPNDPGMSQ